MNDKPLGVRIVIVNPSWMEGFYAGCFVTALSVVFWRFILF